MQGGTPLSRRNQAVLIVCLGLVLSNNSVVYAQTFNTGSAPERNAVVFQPAEKGPPVLNNLNFGMHTMFLNPRYMDAEMNGSLRFHDLIDLVGFVGIVPRTWGHGGSHYGEFKSALRLFAWGGFSIGPGLERVTASNTLDFTKYGLSGKVKLRDAIFDWELFPYSTRGPGGAGIWYSIPISGPWKMNGFGNYMSDGKLVAKLNLQYQILRKFDIMVEYFHNGFLKGADQDRVGVGIAYKVK